MSGTVKFWSDERIAELRDCAAKGMTIPEASAVFDKSEMAIRWQARDKEIKFLCVRPGWTDQEDAALRDLVKEGYGWKAIARILDKTKGCVAGHAFRRNITFIGKKSQPAARPYRHVKPTRKSTIIKRKCLGPCGQYFKSKWIGNRICKVCASSRLFQNSGSRFA